MATTPWAADRWALMQRVHRVYLMVDVQLVLDILKDRRA
jgi:hypothetical protein